MASYKNSTFTIPIKPDPLFEKIIKTHSQEFRYQAKKVFLEIGDTPDGIYYIHHGRTKHYILSDEGTEKIIYTLSDGWIFGETPVVMEEPTRLISETMEPTTIWRINQTTYQNLFDHDKLFRDGIMENMARKLLIMRMEIEDLVFSSVKQRILRLICSTADTSRLIDGAWYNLLIKYTQYEIATIVGGARVTTCKLINELCDDGDIRMLNRNMQVSKAAYERLSEET